MKENIIDSPIFFEDHQVLMTLDSEKVVDFILNHDYPKELVNSFSEENLYFLMSNVGIEHSSSILALASKNYWEYLLDIEIWNKDSLNYIRLTNLLTIMMNADAIRFAKWCFYDNFQLIELYLFRNIEIQIIDEDQDNIDGLRDGFFTNDGVFYINFINYKILLKNKLQFMEERDILLKNMLLQFSNLDHVRYQALLMEVLGIIPSEIEEELFRLKNIRLAEKGFLPFHEAISIYQPITLQNFKKGKRKILKKDTIDFYFYPLPHFSPKILKNENLFVNIIKNFKNNFILNKLQIEFISLCNLLIVADNKKIKGYDDLKEIVCKTSSFLSIGLEYIMLDAKQKNISFGCEILKNYTFENIFRMGHKLILDLSHKTLKWYRKSWFNNNGLNLSFWGEQWFGLIGGLLLNNPMVFRDYEYFNFKSYYEIHKTEKILDQIIDIDSMFACFKLDLSKITGRYFINKKNLILTLWFLYNINRKEKNNKFYPIKLEKFKLFYEDLWENSNGKRRIKNNMKTDFLFWVSNRIGNDLNSLPLNLSSFFNVIFQKLEDELSLVSNKDLEAKYIDKLFIIED